LILPGNAIAIVGHNGIGVLMRCSNNDNGSDMDTAPQAADMERYERFRSAYAAARQPVPVAEPETVAA
jgi:hypothetical protein